MKRASSQVTCAKLLANRKQCDFPAIVAASLRRLGARPAQCYDGELDTVAGTLRVTPYENWIACRFDDVEAAKQRVRFGTLNPWSGKWNWHFERPDANDAEFFVEQIERLLNSADPDSAEPPRS